jgi:hypothetical protein
MSRWIRMLHLMRCRAEILASQAGVAAPLETAQFARENARTPRGPDSRLRHRVQALSLVPGAGDDGPAWSRLLPSTG